MTTQNKNYLVDTLKSHQTEITNLMPPIVKDTKKFFNNTITAIRRNPDLFKYTLQPASCLKLICEVERLARVGLMIGGTRPQAYIVPFGGSPTAIPSADGYKFIVTAGEHALFKRVDLFPIYKGDKFELNEPSGIFEKKETSGDNFNQDMKDFQGFVFVGILNEDNTKIVKKVTANTIAHHKKFSKDNRVDSFWNKHPMRMAEKTAMKHVLRDYIFMCEGLANLSEFEVDEIKSNNEEKAMNLINSDSKPPAKKAVTKQTKKTTAKTGDSVVEVL